MNRQFAVGHVVRRYLQRTETFIQSYLTHAQQHLPHVLTDILFSDFARDTPCVYLIAHDQINQMRLQDRHFFLSQMDYPTCYAKTVGERQMRVLHAHFGLMGYRTLALKHKTQLPLVVSFYGIDASHMLRETRWQRAFQQLFDNVDRVTALGSDMANRLCDAGCDPEKIRILHLGVDLKTIPFHQRKYPLDGVPIVLLYCGRLVEKKGVLDALQAFARVAKAWPSLVFRIVGDGPLRLQLCRAVRQLGVGHRVELCGALSHKQVLQEMANAHVFILPSKTAQNGDMEGTPTVLLEAQASGLPVLSTHHADIPELVQEGQSGFLVNEGDVTALSERLGGVLENPHLWNDLRKAGRAHVQAHYNIRREVKKLEWLYHGLISS